MKDEVVLGKKDGQHMKYQVLNYDYDKLLSHKTEELKKVQSEQAMNYRSAEADYGQFVKENYGEDNSEPHENLAQLCLQLRESLARVGATKNWTSMNYASEGVQELRKHGYSARYVEGYYVDGRRRGEQATIEVKSSDAHAWAEVYKEDVGFVPVELTPGYYDNLVIEEERNVQEQVHEVTQMEGISSDVPQEEIQGEIAWSRYILIGLLALLVLLFAFVVFVIVRNVIVRRKRNCAFSSEIQRIRVEMLSSYMLLLYVCDKKNQGDLPKEYAELWNKFWFSSEGILEMEEEQSLFDYSQQIKKQLMNKSSFIRRMYLRTIGV